MTELVVGGASLTMLDFAEELAAEHEVVIAHGHLDDPANAAVRRARARFPSYELPRLARPLEPRADLLAMRAFAALCRHVRPDVIHTHSSKAGFIGRLVAPPEAAIRFHTIHGWGHTPLDPPLRRRLLIDAERLAARRTTKLVAVSSEVRDEGLALRIGRPAQYAVIGAPVDMRPLGSRDFDAARARARASLELPRDAEVVGWVGRFSAQKDPDALVKVLTRLLRRHNAYAVLVGDGPARAAVQQRLGTEIAERRVRITGLRSDVRALYAAFDVLLHTSAWEGHPRVVREALAERVPVVTARVGGTGVVSSDPALGAEVEAGDVAAYCAALEAILDAPDRRAPIDERALASLRSSADEPYRLMRELYATSLAHASHQPP
ncbi:MAG: glycosyltransferase [Acidobacteriota bacterium]|nr:glycosyltransferase [Acidobacteriota bacterium]